MTNEIANELFVEVNNRLIERRDPDIYGLARYLDGGKEYEGVKRQSLLPYPAKYHLDKIAKQLYD